MAAAPLLSLLLLASAVNTGLCIEVGNKLDFWEDEEPAVDDNEVEPRPPVVTVDVHVVVANGSASPATSTDNHRDVPIYVPVEVVTHKPATHRPWKPQGGFVSTSTVSVPDVPIYVPVDNGAPSASGGHQVHYEDVPVLIGTSGVKHVKADGSQKTVPVVVPISINISTGKQDKAPPTHHRDVPIVIGSDKGKHHTATSTVPPDVPVVYGLNLGPRFHHRGGVGGGFVRPSPGPELQDRTFWWPPVVAIAPRPWLPAVQLPHFRPQPPQPPPRPAPVTTSTTTTTTTTTASSLDVDGKLDFGDA